MFCPGVSFAWFPSWPFGFLLVSLLWKSQHFFFEACAVPLAARAARVGAGPVAQLPAWFGGSGLLAEFVPSPSTVGV